MATYYTKKRRSTRKPAYKRRRTVRARPAMRMSTVANKTHSFVRRTLTTYVPNANTLFGTATFKLSNLTSVTDFSNLFDRFKIVKVVTKFYLRNDPGSQSINLGNNSWFPKLYIFRDRDDDSTPTSVAAMRERSSCKVIVFNPVRPIVLTCIPNVLMVGYESPTLSSYTPKYKQWIDFDDVATPHFGWKWAIDDIPSTASNLSPYAFDREDIYYFQCKDVL